MEAGRLRERVTIEREIRQSNGQGGWVTDWSPIARKVPAEIVGMTGDEALRLGVERSIATYRVTIRKREDVDTKHRLKWGDQVLAVTSVLPHPGEPHTLQLLICTTGFGS